MSNYRNVFVLVPAVLLATALNAQEAEVEFRATGLGEGLYMLEGVGGFAGGNLGLSVGPDGVVLIDDSMPPFEGRMMKAITAIVDRPIDFLINTHVHGDHVGNNAALARTGAVIVAHDNLRRRLLEDGFTTEKGQVPAPKEALPVVTFSESVTLHLNGLTARVFHVHDAHTDGDGVIQFQEADVIHAGDILFNGLFPFIDLESGGSVDGYIAAQETVLSLAGENTRIIPGHGPLASRADLEASVAMLKEARSRIARLIAGGKSEEEAVAANPLADYHDAWNWDFITTERMTRQLYRGLSD